MLGGDSITFQYRYRKQIVLGILILLFIGISIFFILKNIPKKKNMEPVKTVSFKKEKETEKEEVSFKVDIKGEIAYPGIYSLEENSRVIDVINMAGGLTENADTTVLNLSKRIKDEMVIIIYSREEVEHFKETKQVEKQVQQDCVNGIDSSLKNDACWEDNFSNNGLININQASMEELMSLPGVGEAKAKDIIQYREENGSFQSIEEILNVNGIGESIYSQIKEIIIV